MIATIIEKVQSNCKKLFRFKNIFFLKSFSVKVYSFLLLSLSLQSFGTTFAQQISLNIKNVSLQYALKELQKQTTYNILVNASYFKKANNVTINLHDASLEEVLELIFKNQPLQYSIKNNIVTISELPANQHSKVVSQQNSASGIIKDANGKGLEGVTVKEKGTNYSTTTNGKGEFTLKVKSPSTVLQLSMVGYENREVNYRGASISVTLTSVDTKIDEVVITGYQNIRKRTFTGASTKLKAEDIRRDGVTDVSRMLEGQVAGVTVQNVSGTFGAAPKIRVRGATSITGENKPLWVVDGIVLEDVVNVSNEQLSTGDPSTLLGSAVAGINPDDIESFEILKDAAATSLYGARAMNGVVVITTKKGKSGSLITSYTGNFTTSLKPDYGSYDILDSYNQMKIFNELYMKGWLNYTEILGQSRYGVFGTLAKGMSYNSKTNSFDIVNDHENIANYLDKYSRVNTDWFDELFNNSIRQEHALSISGGSEKLQTYGSTSYLNDQGWAKGNDAKRLTANLRTTFTPNEKLSYGFLGTAYIRDQHAPGTLQRTANKNAGGFNREFDINPFNYALNTSRTTPVFNDDGSFFYVRNNYAPFNILEELDNNYLHIKSIDFKLQGELRYKILPELTYALDAAYRYVKTSQDHIIEEESNMPRAYRAGTIYDPLGVNSTIISNNPYLYRDPTNVEDEAISVLPYGGFRNRDAVDMDNYTFRNSLNYSKLFNETHRIDLFAFQELRYIERNTSSYKGVGYQYDRGGVPNIDPAIFYYWANKGEPYYEVQPTRDRFLAFAATGTYSYKDKLSIGGTIRYDGTNAMGQSKIGRWLPTWNVSGAWNVDGEPWFKKQHVLSTLKVRSSYGLVASIGIAKNSGLVLRNSLSPRPYLNENEPIMNIERLANKELTWEKMYKWNLGTDMTFLNGRYNFTVDYYSHNSFDLIGDLRTSSIGGETIKTANYANLTAKGIEVTIGGTLIKNDKWKYNTSLNFGYNKSKIKDLRGNPTINSLVSPSGGPLVGYPQRGLFSIQYTALNPETGAPSFINEEGTVSNNVYMESPFVSHLKYEGSIDPTFSGGFNNVVSFKNLSLNVLLTGSMGNKIRMNPAFFDQYTDLNALSWDFLNRWVLNSDNQVPSILGKREAQLLAGEYPNSAYNFSDQRIADGGFIRLKQVRLSYNLPTQWLKAIRFKSASVSLVGNNIALLYSDKRLNGQDPEFFASGGVALPLSKDYTVSLKLGL